MKLTQEDIIKLAQGDRRTQNKVFKDLLPFTLMICNQNEDNASQVLFLAFSRIKDEYVVEQFISLIKKIANQRNIDQYRMDSVRKKHIPMNIESVDSNFFMDEIVPDNNYQLLYEAVNKLNARQKEVILLYLQGFLLTEISVKLNVNPQTVKSLLKRGREKLRIYLKKEDFF